MEWLVGYFNFVKFGDVIYSFNFECCVLKYFINDFFVGVIYIIDLIQLVGECIIDLKFVDGILVKDNSEICLGMNSYCMGYFIKKGGILEG